MSRHALRGISQVIKANTTEKSIDDLRAEGKKRVRVVSSERVMAIIQAIVDDTIASEVGEITRRDRDRIVSDTQDRFSRVLKMQQDLEQSVDDLRGSLRTSELERERLRADKASLESQLSAAHRPDGDIDAVARMGRDLARVRDVVERAPRESGSLDEAALARVAEKLAARDTQSARRLGAEFEDLRARLESVSRDTSTARDTVLEKVLQRVKEQQSLADVQLTARLDREFRTVAERLAEIREESGRRPGDGDAVTQLRGNLDALENRIHGVERPPADTAERISRSVLTALDVRDAAADARRAESAALEARRAGETIEQREASHEEAHCSILLEVAALRSSLDEDRNVSTIAQAGFLRDLEHRIADIASEGTAVMERTIERLADRTATLDGSLQGLRREVAGIVERPAPEVPAPASQEVPPALTEALQALRTVANQTATDASRTANVQAAVTTRLDGVLSELRADLQTLNARGTESGERQHEAIQALRDEVARSAAVQSASLQASFKASLESALDRITRTMEAATARTIETGGEATEILVARVFDAPETEITSNLGQLEVEERRTGNGIAKSVGRLKELNGRAKAEAVQPV